ncbi:MAG: hypothetical protein HOW73_36805 [Polyangiaceae bacterium]|nr:hypothetical protein [Polyangiaceae bacterium]
MSQLEHAAEGFVSVAHMAEALRVPGAALPGSPFKAGSGARSDRDLVPHVDARELDVTAARLARDISSSARRVIGLLPAGPTSDALSLAEPLGRGVVMLDGRFSVVLDPERRSVPADAPSGGVAIARALTAGVVLIAPNETMRPGAKAEGIKQLLGVVRQREDTWRAVFVDLSGCALPGELLDVLPLFDGIVIVGRSGKATETELRRSSARVPSELNMGVVLLD